MGLLFLLSTIFMSLLLTTIERWDAADQHEDSAQQFILFREFCNRTLRTSFVDVGLSTPEILTFYPPETASTSFGELNVVSDAELTQWDLSKVGTITTERTGSRVALTRRFNGDEPRVLWHLDSSGTVMFGLDNLPLLKVTVSGSYSRKRGKKPWSRVLAVSLDNYR